MRASNQIDQILYDSSCTTCNIYFNWKRSKLILFWFFKHRFFKSNRKWNIIIGFFLFFPSCIKLKWFRIRIQILEFRPDSTYSKIKFQIFGSNHLGFDALRLLNSIARGSYPSLPSPHWRGRELEHLSENLSATFLVAIKNQRWLNYESGSGNSRALLSPGWPHTKTPDSPISVHRRFAGDSR